MAFDAAACIGCGACVAACPNASAMLFTAAKVSHLGLLPQGQAERDRRVLAMVGTMDGEEFGATSLQLASGTPRMFTHCPTPSAAGGHAQRHDPVRPPFGSASWSAPSFPCASTPLRRMRAASSAPVAAARRSACWRRAAASASCLCAAASAPFSSCGAAFRASSTERAGA